MVSRWAWREPKGPLHSDVFRRLNTLQLHAPLDKCGLQRLETLRSSGLDTFRTEDRRATRVRQVLNIVVGISVGVVAVFMRLSYQHISSRRVEAVLWLLSEGNSWTAALLAASVTALLCLCASAMVAWQPAAASSGIPGVIAYLNGVDLNHALGPKVLIAKIVGTVLAVGSGLAVGPEGPMIHIGAMVGRFVVHGLLGPILRCLGKHSKFLQTELERLPLRYDVQAAAMGAGAGIAAAFQAPIAGTVFVVEEAASFFSKRLFFHTFITCSSALATTMGLDWLLSAEAHSFYSRTAECNSDQMWSSLLLLQIVLVGVLCGLFGWLFNRGVVAIAKKMTREAYALGQTRMFRLRRFGVVLVIGALSGAFWVVFSAERPCADASLQMIFTGSSGCLPQEWMSQLTLGTHSVRVEQVDYGYRRSPVGPLVSAYLPAPGLFGAQFDPVLCPLAVNRTGGQCRIPGIEKHIANSSKLKPDHFCCGFRDLDSLQRGEIFSFQRPAAPLEMVRKDWPLGACKSGHQDEDNKVWIPHYSPAASLTLVNPSTLVQNLLVRGSPGVLPATDLLVFLLGYGSLAVLSTGAWVPGGLLVPLMTLGAATGRLCGLAWGWVLAEHDAHRARPPVPWVPELQPLVALIYPGAREPKPGMPPEPGILAIAGCAAFLSGSGALALFVIVLLVEITLEPFLIPVVIIAVLAARGTASLLGFHGLYHELMQVQSLPFLGEHTHWRQEHYVVTDVLKEDAAVAHRRVRLEVEEMPEMPEWSLFDSGASASAAAEQDISRAKKLLVAVEVDASCDEVRRVLDDHPMVNGFPVVGEEGRLQGLATRAALEELLSRVPQQGGHQPSRSGAAVPLAEGRGCLEQATREPAGVEWVMDCAPFVVPASTHLKHAHMLFYQCGLRHVVVVDCHYRPLGLLTRKSLAPWRVPRAPGGDRDTFAEPRSAHTPIHSPAMARRPQTF